MSKLTIPGTNENREGFILSPVPRAVVTEGGNRKPSGHKGAPHERNNTMTSCFLIIEMDLIIYEMFLIIGRTRNPYDVQGRYANGRSDATFEILYPRQSVVCVSKNNGSEHTETSFCKYRL